MSRRTSTRAAAPKISWPPPNAGLASVSVVSPLFPNHDLRVAARPQLCGRAAHLNLMLWLATLAG